MPFLDEKKPLDFDALKLTLASPEKILSWSRGEVTKPETINYRTQKPEKDGLFCERIFGPSKDWECYCGKYKKIRYKGIVCDKCGVEVTRSLVRRERMGHITLATPASHIWFLRGVPSKIGLILDLSLQNLERVIYFADFIIVAVDEDLKKDTLEQIRQEYKAKRKKIEQEFNQKENSLKAKIINENKGKASEELNDLIEEKILPLKDLKNQQTAELESIIQSAEQELKELKPLTVISEHKFQDLSLKYGHIFEAGIGAEAIRKLLTEINLEKLKTELSQGLKEAKTPAKDKIIKRLRLVNNLLKNKIRPEWTVVTVMPVIPPDLRPMVPLDGGRFATSDLNDLYRRIINRNNRLKQLIELNAPEVICRNEKRMLQEAVDALIDNSARHGKTVTASTGQKRMLKSLADILRGKQGRFRQNLLGKRIDYSGRSVIVVGPKIKINECGLPKKMALELFKPFIISQLIKEETVHNVRSAAKFIESGQPRVWDILEEVTKDAVVLLNRAPTLHRLGIQAFRPVLIEGKAIQIHPLVCPAFNADFDGDQMAVHVPLTEEAKWEAKNIMMAAKNLLKPATGAPIANPGKDIVWGCYYLTMLKSAFGENKIFVSPTEAIMAWQLKMIGLQEAIKIKTNSLQKPIEGGGDDGRLAETSIGRLLFNQILPKDFKYFNLIIDNSVLKEIVAQLLDQIGADRAAVILDEIKELGFKHITLAGYSWGIDDIPKIKERNNLIAEGEREVKETESQYETGLLTGSEKHAKIIEIWMKTKDKIVKISQKALDPTGPIYTMVESGARGSWSQLIQIMGMKGLVTNPAGEIIELPVKGNFKEGFDVLEYFISTHGARKGLSDTALRTANAGYLTRRLVDVAQDIVITIPDCKDKEGITITKKDSEAIGLNLESRVVNRFILETIKDPQTQQPIIKKGALITKEIAARLKALNLEKIKVRSVMSCQSERGVCQKCYGFDLGYNKLVELGTAVGIIAAQSIGEPGTQLTMRTFHTGGVAGLDITQGLPRVEEIFECRSPKFRALVAEAAGTVKIDIDEITRQKIIKIQTLANKTGGKEEKDGKKEEELKVSEYKVPPEYYILVKDGDKVKPGDPLTDGSLDIKQLYRYKGIAVCQRYIVDEIQKIYASQGQKLNDKHIELIARQMFSRVYVREAGETNFLAGSRVEWPKFLAENRKTEALKKKPALGEQLLLGITKVSLSTTSFLSAASFQETSRVLINAAVEGRIDRLEGLKENVIIGRLIPAGTGFRKKVANG